jgi:hypothetical protein
MYTKSPTFDNLAAPHSKIVLKLALKKQMPTVLRTKVEKPAPEPTQYTYLHESSHAAQRLVPAHARPPDDCHRPAKKQLEPTRTAASKPNTPKIPRQPISH